MTLEMWTDRQDKIQTFFGPGVQAEVQKTEKVFYCLYDMFTKKYGSQQYGSQHAARHLQQHPYGRLWQLLTKVGMLRTRTVSG